MHPNQEDMKPMYIVRKLAIFNSLNVARLSVMIAALIRNCMCIAYSEAGK